MTRNKHIDYSGTYIVRKRPDYWAWLVMAIVVGYFMVGDYGWNLRSLLLPGILLFMFVFNFLERNVHIVMNEEGMRIGKELLLWKDIEQGRFKKKRGNRAYHVNVLEITLKDGSLNEIFIDDYKYDREKFCDVFNFHCKSKRRLIPHTSQWSEFLRLLIVLIIIFVVVFVTL